MDIHKSTKSPPKVRIRRQDRASSCEGTGFSFFFFLRDLFQLFSDDIDSTSHILYMPWKLQFEDLGF